MNDQVNIEEMSDIHTKVFSVITASSLNRASIATILELGQKKKCIMMLAYLTSTLLFLSCNISITRATKVESSRHNLLPSQFQTEDETIQSIIKLIEACPAWSSTPEKDAEGRQAILEHLKEISRYDINLIRRAIEIYIGGERMSATSTETSAIKRAIERYNSYSLADKRLDITSMSRLYVLNRYLFNVPPKVQLSRPTFGGWHGVPHNAGEINWFWPLSFDSDGNIALTGVASGYTGPPYEALEEFDYFHRAFGLRKPFTWKER